MTRKEKNLTSSQVARQNILNNVYALKDIQNEIGLQGVIFKNEFKFIKKQTPKPNGFGVFECSVR